MSPLVYILIFLFLSNNCSSNNVDVLNLIPYASDDLTSLFGYNVKLYTDSIKQPSLLIGAPRAEGSSSVPQTGNVFSCSATNASMCSPLPLTDLAGPNTMRQDSPEIGSYIAERKDNMWLGVSIETSVNGQIITCAHRHVDTGNGNNLYMHGLCHFLTSLTTSSIILQPCRSCNLQSYYHCLSGLGLNIDRSGVIPFIGTPGAYQFTGEIFHGMNYQSCGFNFSPDNINLDPQGNDALFGLSITRGRVINRNFEDVISTMPRYNYLFGGVVIFRNESGVFDEKLIIYGQHFGAYFGHSVITCDIDGDGLDEILVGQPTFSTQSLSEVGLVQVFSYDLSINNFTNITLEHPDPLEFSRFGFSMANLGDINKKSGSEFAIGAPFGSTSGVVYIYTWDSQTSLPILYQKIDTSSVSPSSNIVSFGASISPGLDVDGNNYEDLLIGAPLSNQVFLMHTFPVIYLNSQFSFNTEHIYIMNADTCYVPLNGVNDVLRICFAMDYLLSFSGQNTPENVTVRVDILLDTILHQRGFHSRVYFVRDGLKTDTISLQNLIIRKDELQTVISETIYVESSPVDLFTPVQFRATVSEMNRSNSTDYFQDVKILGESMFEETLAIRNVNCGTDNNCESDLSISGSLSFMGDQLQNTTYPDFIVNEVKQILLNFTIQNSQEEALSPILSLALPQAVELIRIRDSEYRIHNETLYGNGSSLILIDLTTSLVQNESILIAIILASSQLVDQFENFTINFNVKSINYENPNLIDDNFGEFFVQVKRRSILQLQAFLQTDQVYYNNTNTYQNSMFPGPNLQSLGSEVIHSYSLVNLKSSTVSQLRINFHWLLGDLSSQRFLLYLTSIEHDATLATVRCDDQFVNYLNFSNTLSRSVRSTRSPNEYKLFKRDAMPVSNTIDCDTFPSYCAVFSCQIFQLPPSQGIRFTIKSRVFETTLNYLSPSAVNWQITTKVSLDIIVPGVDYISAIPSNKRVLLTTNISPQKINLTYFTLQWYHIIPIILAIAVPCVLFIIIFIALYICGFFKIKKRGRQDIQAVPEEEFEEETNNFNMISSLDEYHN